MTLLQSGLPEHVSESEFLSRFLFQRSQFSSTGVSHTAFLPGNRDGETSVFRHGKEPLEDLKRLGLAVAEKRELTLRGAAVLTANAVRNVGLLVEASEPPARHAAIRGWPFGSSDPDLERARRKELALVLAHAAGAPVRFS